MLNKTPESRHRLSAHSPFFIVFYLFLMVNVLLVAFKSALAGAAIDPGVVGGGNGILLVATLLSLVFLNRSLLAQKGSDLLRNVYAGIFIKLMVCALAAFVYILRERKEVNKPGLLLCGGLYILYTFLEVSLILKRNKPPKHGQAASTP